MAKKFGKFLLFTAAVSAVGAAAYYYMKKKDSVFFDETDEDYDDFSEDVDDDGSSRTYVPLNPESVPASSQTEAQQDKSAEDSFTPLTEKVSKVTDTARDAAEAVEEFFDERTPAGEAEASEEFFDDGKSPS